MRRWMLVAALLAGCGSNAPPPATYSFPGCPPEVGGSGGCPSSATFECAQGHLATQFAGPCASDADCTWAPVTGSCFSDCGSVVAVAHESEFETEIHDQLDHFCAGSQCNVPLGCSAPPAAVCRSGTCVAAPVVFFPDAGCLPPAPPSFCSPTACYASWPDVMSACDPALQLSFCGGLDLAFKGGLDSSATGYFDADSGALVAVVSAVSVSNACQGPSDFVAPDCEADAGAFAISCDAGM